MFSNTYGNTLDAGIRIPHGLRLQKSLIASLYVQKSDKAIEHV